MGVIKTQGIQNTIISYTGIGIGFVSTLLIQPLFLSTEELGLTRFLVSFSTIAGVLFTLGLGGFTLRFFPQFRDAQTGHRGYLRFILLICSISFLFFLALAFIFKQQILSWYDNSLLLQENFEFLIPMSFCYGFTLILGVYSIGLFRSSVPSFLNDIFTRVTVVTVVILYHYGYIHRELFIPIYVSCYVLQLLVLIVYILKIDTGYRHPIRWDFLREDDRLPNMMKYLLWLLPGSLATVAFRQIDVTMLGSDINTVSPLKDMAVYTIGFTIGMIIEAPYNAIVRIADSRLSEAIHNNDMVLVKKIYRTSTRVLMIIGGLLLIGVCINIKTMLSFLPGKFSDSWVVVIIIGISSFFNMSTGVNNPMVFFTKYFKKGTLLTIGLLCVSILTNYLLIPHYGIYGAAIATGSTLLLYNVAKTFLTWKWFAVQPYGKYVLYVAIAIIAAFGINWIIPELDNRLLDMFVRSLAVTLVYAGIILVSGIFPEGSGFIKKHTGIRIGYPTIVDLEEPKQES
ncbi:MAG: lipopolysaccharide biosynthesis protein [Bacteroidia bacterium]